MEASAIGLLKRAVELDNARRFTEAMICYQEGIQLLIQVMKDITEEAKRQRYRQKIEEYMNRAEKLKKAVEKEKAEGKYHEQIQIDNDSTGHSYEKLFAHFLDEHVTVIEVQDPYIRNNHQIYNFVRFCELVVKSKAKCEFIKLLTGLDKDAHAQKDKLHELGASLEKFSIKLVVEYSETLHDREIRLNNGWIIKVGRGLDIYKPTHGKFVIGYCDYELRPCHETTVDIFHSKGLVQKSGT